MALLLPRPPRRIAASTFRDGDSAATVLAGDAAERWRAPVRDPAGLAQAAFVYPLAHGATFRAAIPLDPGPRARRRGPPTGGSWPRRRSPTRCRRPRRWPPGGRRRATGACAWCCPTTAWPRRSPPTAGSSCCSTTATRSPLARRPTTGSGSATPPICCRRSTTTATTTRWPRSCASYPERQRGDGFFFSQENEWDSNGAALVALARHWRLARDTPFVEGIVEPIARGAHWIDRKRRSSGGRKGRGDAALAGLLPAGTSAEHLGPVDQYYWDDFWGVAGLRAAADLLRAAGQPDAAADASGFAARMWSDVEASLAVTAGRLGTAAIPAGPRRRIDAGAMASLVACAPLELLAADDPRIVATADALRERFTLEDGRAFFQGISHSGLGTYLTMQLAAVELRAGDHRSVDRLAWMLDAATPTWTWPEAIHPRIGGGCMGDGHHGWAAAEVLSFVARPAGARGHRPRPRRPTPTLALSSLVPASWYGQGWEVHDAPTAHGSVSYAVRWHGDRVALLWEVDPHPGVAAVRLVAPALDASWSTTDPRGEALLGPVPPPPPPSPDGNGSAAPAPPVAVAASDPEPPPDEGGSFA